MTPSVSYQKLRQFYLFAELDDLQLDRIKKKMRLLELPEGSVLFNQGEPASSFFAVVNGHIKLTRLSTGGNEKVVEIINADQSFAEAVMFMPQQVYPVTARAIDECRVLAFDNMVFLNILRESFETCLRVFTVMSYRIHWWLKEVDNLTLQNATYRLINYLLAQTPKRKTDKGLDICFDIPKHVVASRLSMQPETLSRILHNLSQQKLVMVKNQMICIHDVEKLRFYLQSTLE